MYFLRGQQRRLGREFGGQTEQAARAKELAGAGQGRVTAREWTISRRPSARRGSAIGQLRLDAAQFIVFFCPGEDSVASVAFSLFLRCVCHLLLLLLLLLLLPLSPELGRQVPPTGAPAPVTPMRKKSRRMIKPVAQTAALPPRARPPLSTPQACHPSNIHRSLPRCTATSPPSPPSAAGSVAGFPPRLKADYVNLSQLPQREMLMVTQTAILCGSTPTHAVNQNE